jgi:hypothetical protein
MRLSPKLTWGLAWTGLALVLAVPSADFLTGQFGKDGRNAAVLTSDIEPVKTAAVEPAAPAKTTKVTTVKTDKGIKIVPAGSTPAAGASDDPVERYLAKGKPLPDFISDGDAPQTGEPNTEDQQVAIVTPGVVVAPRLPLPATARPRPMMGPPAPTAPAAVQPEAVIVDESTLTGSLAEPAGPVPPSPIVDDIDNWDTESLREYLERRGILEGSDEPARSSATVTQRDDNYDPDGFYLSDGPNSDRTSRETRRQRILRMLQENDGGEFTLF